MFKKLDNLAVKYNLYLFISIIFAIMIFLGSVAPEKSISLSSEEGSLAVKNSGFAAHLISYFALSFAFLLYFSSKNFNKPYLKSALLAGSYGVFIEIVQSFITYRHFQIYDMIINFTGACLIVGIYLIKKIKATKF